MPQIFADGFELGNTSLWSEVRAWNGGIPAVVTTRKHLGSYSFQGTSPAPVAPATYSSPRSEVVHAVAGLPTELYARVFVYVESGLPLPAPAVAGQITGMRFLKFYGNGVDTGAVAEMGISRDSAGLTRWTVFGRRGTDPVAGTPLYFTGWGSDAVAGQWYCIELYVKCGTAGEVRCYVNGVLDISVTGIDTSGRGTAIISASTGYMSVSTTQQNVGYVDDYILSTEPIGCAALPVNPKLTVNSSPEINVPVYVDGSLVGNTPLTVEVPSGTHIVRVESEVTR